MSYRCFLDLRSLHARKVKLGFSSLADQTSAIPQTAFATKDRIAAQEEKANGRAQLQEKPCQGCARKQVCSKVSRPVSQERFDEAYTGSLIRHGT